MNVSEFLKALNEPEYVHVLINHLPVEGLLFGMLILALGPILKNRAMTLTGLALVGLFALSVYPVVYFGEAGYNQVYSMVYQRGHAWLDYHMQLANTWKWLYYATGAIALIGFGLGLWKSKTLWVGVPLVFLLAIGCLIAGMAISQAGGKVRHREFRLGPESPPTTSQAQDDDPVP